MSRTKGRAKEVWGDKFPKKSLSNLPLSQGLQLTEGRSLLLHKKINKEAIPKFHFKQTIEPAGHKKKKKKSHFIKINLTSKKKNPLNYNNLTKIYIYIYIYPILNNKLLLA